ncbi:flavin reductase family protein [Angustibacter sp. McL0619]|uniref:flavin reductase family protein n=1 Tax=Angustibacter sp. McL0619 TaxID=3415676 RepID=UPI003CF5C5EC
MDDRLELTVADLRRGATYPWLTSVVVPRPIAWVSSLSADGVRNLAPHSFFTVASAEPPIVSFTSVRTKDSLRNIRATGEFVVNLATRELAEQVNRTGTDFPPEVDELQLAGLTPAPSVLVAPPRVAESPVALECVFAGEHTFTEDGRGSTVVFGRVVHLSVSRRTIADDGLPDIHALHPAARLGRDQWSAIGEVFELARLPYEATGP